MCEALRRTLPVVSLLSDEDDQLEDDLVSLHLRQDDELDILDTEDFEESDVYSGKRTTPCSACSIGILTYSIEQTSSIQCRDEF